MKKKLSLLFGLTVILAMFLIYGQRSDRFNGSKIWNADTSRFSLRFDMLNTEEKETIPLLEGDQLRVSWQIEDGSIDLVISMEGAEPIYRADGRGKGDTADFELSIPADGDYIIRISGRKAKGWMEFVKE